MAQIKFEKLDSNPVDTPSNNHNIVVTEVENRYRLYVSDNDGVHKKLADSWHNEITPNVSFIDPVDGDRVYLFRANKGDATLKSVTYAIRGTGSCEINVYKVLNPNASTTTMKTLTVSNNKDEIETSITSSAIDDGNLVFVEVTDVTGSVLEVYIELAIEYNE